MPRRPGTLTWTLFQLCTYSPGILRKLVNELTGALQDDPPEASRLPQLALLN